MNWVILTARVYSSFLLGFSCSTYPFLVMADTHSLVSVPQKRKMELEGLSINDNNTGNDFMNIDDHLMTVKPPKLRRILAKYPEEDSSANFSSHNVESYFLESVAQSHSTIQSIETITEHYRKISFRILRINLLHRDATARMDKQPHIIDDIYDINGEENKLAWPLNMPPKEPVIIAPKPRAADIPIHSTRVLRSSQRQSTSSPSTSKSSTPVPPALESPIIIPLGTTSKDTLESSASPLPSPEALVVKTDPELCQIPPYKKLPSRGDSVQKRIAKLQADPWSDASKLTAKSVFCIGCQKSVCLDKRFDYYPGFWETHKRRCPFVQNGTPKQDETVTVIEQANST
ncbi:MAG: hypothetical protein NXY57DRAFT_776573 [Lentinula lateritia]|nr:MAG: hypothetical protein NXY57DRAFT_776573 [Lentinula lateritia]